MGFIEDKKDVINNVALFGVLGNLPKGKSISSLKSVNSKSSNLAPYLVDMLATTCKDNKKTGQLSKCSATNILKEILTDSFPVLIDGTKKAVIEGIKYSLSCGGDFTLPNFPNGAPSAKITTKISKIDYNGMTKIDPNSNIGSTFFGKSPNKDFNWFLGDVVQNGGQANWKNIMDVNYAKPNQEVQIGISTNFTNNSSFSGFGGGPKLDDFLNNYMNSIEIVDRETFLRKMTDKLTGAAMAQLPNALNSVDKLVQLEKLDKIQDKIINSDPCKEDYETGDDYFKFTNDELLDIEEKANQKYKGVTLLDLGCAVVPATVDPKTLKDVFDDVRNSSPNKINDTINKSIDKLNESLVLGVNENDKNVAKLNLNTKMLEQIPKTLADVILEPKMVVAYQLVSKLVNGPLTPAPTPVGMPDSTSSLNVTKPNIDVEGSFDFTKFTSKFFEVVVRECQAILIKILFDKIKEEVIKLVQDLVAKILAESLKLKSKQLSSVIMGSSDGILSTVSDKVSDFGTDLYNNNIK